MSTATPGGPSLAPASCVYIDALAFSWPHFAGISRYTARLSLALGARMPVRFFHDGQEFLTPRLRWSQDQDLEEWGRRVWDSPRRPIETPPPDSIGLYCAPRPSRRTFPYEASVMHDFCPMVVPWAFPDGSRDEYVRFLTEDILASDIALADSHSTKADARWFSPMDPDRIVVAHPGPSLCVETHRHRGRVERSDRIGLVVSTIEPRKNAAFLFDWFHQTTLLPPDAELWWVGKLGWMISEDELERLANRPGGRRIRMLGNVSDAQLCELYQQAGWSIYPSRYEGFGFPILDSLRHGTPVLVSNTSSMREFDHPGVFFFDPRDPATVDAAWRRLRAATEPPIARSRLDELYSWDHVARALLDAYERDRAARPVETPARVRRADRKRIGIEVFGTQTSGRLRGIGRYSCDLVAAMLARDPESDYVLYAQEGLPTNQIPTAPNAVVRMLRTEAGAPTLSHAMERLVETNPDRLDTMLLLDTLEMSDGYDIPARPLDGLRIASVVLDLAPILFPNESHHRWSLPGYARRYARALDRLRNHDVVLTISETTRRDLLATLDLAPDRVVTVGAASDGRFFAPDRSEPMPAESRSLLSALGIARPFIFSVGAADDRKNPRGLIDAFAMLPSRLRRAHQLVLSYGLSGPERGLVRQHARDCGVEDALVLTDRLSDRALRVLYQRCAAFIFPSPDEDLGRPALEAMHCGAAVIAGNNSAQVEVVGDAGLLVDVGDPEDLAAELAPVLDDPDWARDLGELAAVRAGRFRWEATADRVLGALRRTDAPRPSVRPRPAPFRGPRRPIAVFAPLPHRVADESERLLEELASRYAIDVYHDAGYLPRIGLRSPGVGAFDHRLFERYARVRGYHAIVYQMGDSPHHDFMIETMLRHPGIVALHDLGPSDSRLDRRILERAAAIVVAPPGGQDPSHRAVAYAEAIERAAGERTEPTRPASRSSS